MRREPVTFLEAVKAFSDPQAAHDYVAKLRWPNGVACPRSGCGNADVRKIERTITRHKKDRRTGKTETWQETRTMWFCKECKEQFTAKTGTVFEDSPIGFDKWLPAMWLLAGCRNGVSSYEIARDLGVQQRTAWFMLHRIRIAMTTKTFEKMEGPVQADEAYIGRRGMTGDKVSPRYMKPREKAPVFAIVQKHPRRARAYPIEGPTERALIGGLREHVAEGAMVTTDSHSSYKGASKFFLHRSVSHMEGYVRDGIHTNGAENFFSLLKRCINGTYVGVSRKHLGAYCDEQAFRYENVGVTNIGRVERLAKDADGKRLTYRDLIKKPPRK